MPASQVELAQRKARLLERIDTQREQLAAQFDVLKNPLGLADKLVQAAQYVKLHPWIAGVAMFAMVVFRGGGLLRWVSRGYTVWRGWHWAQRWLRDQGYFRI